jgi:hypothetical protein
VTAFASTVKKTVGCFVVSLAVAAVFALVIPHVPFLARSCEVNFPMSIHCRGELPLPPLSSFVGMFDGYLEKAGRP